ncbi:MAG: glycosyltransferase family 9 protein [Armatimonadetes bacterium]|nr:glycosyltransferase family 9 protein [Armatimonadota bacterium]
MPAVSAILALDLNYIGDVLFTTPALAALRRGYPEAPITAVVGERALDVLAANPDVTRVVKRPFTLAGRWRALCDLRAEGCRLAISFSPRSAELAAWGVLAGCRQRWGFDAPEPRWFLNGRVREDAGRHCVDDYLELARAAGGASAGRNPRLYTTPEEDAWARACRSELGLASAAFVLGLHVGATYPEKCWRPERLVEFARLAAENQGTRLVAFGGKGEEAAAEALAHAAPNCLSLAGRLTLRQFIALVKRCSAFVGGDSGPTHIAAALGVPTVALFGFTDPARTGVLGERVVTLRGMHGNADPREQRVQTSPYQWLDPIRPADVLAAAHWVAGT